jgi:hypothetical protein
MCGPLATMQTKRPGWPCVLPTIVPWSIARSAISNASHWIWRNHVKNETSGISRLGGACGRVFRQAARPVHDLPGLCRLCRHTRRRQPLPDRRSAGHRRAHPGAAADPVRPVIGSERTQDQTRSTRPGFATCSANSEPDRCSSSTRRIMRRLPPDRVTPLTASSHTRLRLWRRASSIGSS